MKMTRRAFLTQTSLGAAGLALTSRALAVPAAAGGASAPGRPQDRTPVLDVFTPVTVTPLAPPTTPVRGTDDDFHIVYELVLVNAKPAPATIQRVQVLDEADPSRVLAAYQGADVVERLRTLFPTPAEDDMIEPGGTRLFYIELSFDRRRDIPKALVHHLDLLAAANPGTTESSPLNYIAGRFELLRPGALIVSPPLRGEGWVAANGCCNPQIAHRGAVQTVNGSLYNAQRFAIDWMRLSPEGRFVTGDPSVNANYTAYGADVFAVADGTVVSTLDTLDDQPPGQLPDPSTITLQTVDGNHVVLDVGNGYFAFFAHLQKGTVAVQVGDQVKRGDFLAKLGNSGNTSAPHLHFHIMDSPSVLGSDGRPFVHDRFSYAGQVDIAAFDAAPTLEGVWNQGLVPPERRRRQFPLNFNIIDFP